MSSHHPFTSYFRTTPQIVTSHTDLPVILTPLGPLPQRDTPTPLLDIVFGKWEVDCHIKGERVHLGQKGGKMRIEGYGATPVQHFFFFLKDIFCSSNAHK